MIGCFCELVVVQGTLPWPGPVSRFIVRSFHKIMSRVCQLTGKRANNGMAVSHSHVRTKKLQQVNLQERRLWWAEGQRFVKLRVSTRALKTIQKKGLEIGRAHV